MSTLQTLTPSTDNVVVVSPQRARTWYLIAVSVLCAYSTGVAWQAQLVSYPLYRAVGAADFVAYHQRYGEAIPLVVVLPGFVTFLAGTAFLWARPRQVSRGVAMVVSASSFIALLSTVLWAIPKHDELDRIGQSASTIDSLLQANLVRSLALSAATLALGWSVARVIGLVGTKRQDRRTS
jgi:hypothetical protein